MKRSAIAITVGIALMIVAGCAITESSRSSDYGFTFDVTFFCDEVIGKRSGFEVVVSTETADSTIRFTTENDRGEKKGEATRPITPTTTARATQPAPSSTNSASVITMRLYEGDGTKELAKIRIEDFEDCQEGDIRTKIVG